MVQPERRTKADLVAAAAIALVVAAAGRADLVHQRRPGHRQPARPDAGAEPGTGPPGTGRPSSAVDRRQCSDTSRPVLVGGVIVTGDARQIDGRDPTTGAVRWSYARDTDLCAVSWVYRYAVAVYRDDRGCGQVSTIDGSTGRRGPARSSYADSHVDVTSDGTTVLSAGNTRLEMWRSDMVRMLAYGETDARVKPSSQGLHTGCTLLSTSASSSAVSVLEQCPRQHDLRLALLRPSKEDDEPEQHDYQEPGIDAKSGAQVLAVSETSTALYLPDTAAPRRHRRRQRRHGGLHAAARSHRAGPARSPGSEAC